MAQLGAARPGAETLLQRVRPATLGLVLAKHAGLASILFGVPLIWALIEGSWGLAVALGPAVFAGAIMSALVWSRDLPRDLRGVEAMATIALVFLLSALLSVPAFMTLGLSFTAALFEGMSAVTTTGLSMASAPDDWPFAGHVLRSWMQWCGGLVMATAVVALVLGPGPAARTMGRAGIDDGDRITSTRMQARELLGAYLAITVIAAAAIGLALGRWDEALVLALSAVSTGGFAPRSDSLASYDVLVQSLVIGASVLGAISLLALTQTVRSSGPPLWRAPSVRRVLGAVVLSALLLAIVRPFVVTETGYLPTLLNLLSGLSTAGYSTGPMPTTPALLTIFIVAMIIGGDRGSTAGGLKLARLATAVGATRHALTLSRLSERAVAPLRSDGDVVSPDYLITTLAILLLYVTSTLAVWSMLLLLGHPPMPALFDTISTLSTVGLSTGVIGPDLGPGSQIVLTLAMWMGRLEFIAVLVLILPGTWRARPLKGA